MKKLALILLLIAPVAQAAPSVDDALNCLNTMQTAHPARSPRYTAESKESHFLYVQSGNPQGIGFYHLTPGTIKFCSLNFPRRSGFTYEYQGRRMKYTTSDGQGPAENALPHVTKINEERDCNTSKATLGNGMHAINNQIEAMAQRLAESGTFASTAEIHSAIGSSCLKFERVYGVIGNNFKAGRGSQSAPQAAPAVNQ